MRQKSAARNKRRIEARRLRRWRETARPRLLHAVAGATVAMPWSRDLMNLLLEELYADEHLEELLKGSLHGLKARQYPQAVALAVVLRHSWQPDDFAQVLQRLGLSEPADETNANARRP